MTDPTHGRPNLLMLFAFSGTIFLGIAVAVGTFLATGSLPWTLVALGLSGLFALVLGVVVMMVAGGRTAVRDSFLSSSMPRPPGVAADPAAAQRNR